MSIWRDLYNFLQGWYTSTGYKLLICNLLRDQWLHVRVFSLGVSPTVGIICSDGNSIVMCLHELLQRSWLAQIRVMLRACFSYSKCVIILNTDMLCLQSDSLTTWPLTWHFALTRCVGHKGSARCILSAHASWDLQWLALGHLFPSRMQWPCVHALPVCVLFVAEIGIAITSCQFMCR